MEGRFDWMSKLYLSLLKMSKNFEFYTLHYTTINVG